jgi:hypothetical protein
MSGVGRFNYDLRKYREMGGVECGGCNVYDGIAPIVLAGTVLEEYT